METDAKSKRLAALIAIMIDARLIWYKHSYGWADDLKVGLEREIKELYRQIKEVRRAATAALTLEEKIAGQKQIKALEAQRNQKRRSLFDAQDDVDRQREALIAQIERKLNQKEETERLFLIRWSIA